MYPDGSRLIEPSSLQGDRLDQPALRPNGQPT